MRRANGTGSVYKLSGNRRKPWQAYVPGIKDPVTGRIIQKSLGTYKTRKDAEQALNSYLDNPTTLCEITLQQLYDSWSERHFETISNSTKRTYEFGFKYWSNIKDMQIKDLNTMVLQKELDKLKGKSKSTISQARLTMSQLCKEALRNQLITVDYSELLLSPAHAIPKEKEIFTREEIDTMWDNLQIVQYMEIPLILIYTGMRINELATCKIENVNLEDRYILHGSKTTAGKDRIIPIPKRIFEIIKYKCNNNFKYLIERDGQKVTVDYLRRKMYNKAIECINVNQLTPHACRRTYATLLNANVNNKQYVTRILGHTDFDTTDKYYIVNQSKELVKAVEFLQ